MHEKPFGYLIYWCIKAQKLNSLCRMKWAPVEQKKTNCLFQEIMEVWEYLSVD